MFSIGASKIANTARENVSRYGNIAGQKVCTYKSSQKDLYLLFYSFCFFILYFSIFFSKLFDQGQRRHFIG